MGFRPQVKDPSGKALLASRQLRSEVSNNHSWSLKQEDNTQSMSKDAMSFVKVIMINSKIEKIQACRKDAPGPCGTKLLFLRKWLQLFCMTLLLLTYLDGISWLMRLKLIVELLLIWLVPSRNKEHNIQACRYKIFLIFQIWIQLHTHAQSKTRISLSTAVLSQNKIFLQDTYLISDVRCTSCCTSNQYEKRRWQWYQPNSILMNTWYNEVCSLILSTTPESSS